MDKKTVGIIALSLLVGGGVAFMNGDVSANSVYEKVDNETIKVTQEVSVDLKIQELVKDQESLTNYKNQVSSSCTSEIGKVDAKLAEVSKLIAEAEKLGVTPQGD